MKGGKNEFYLPNYKVDFEEAGTRQANQVQSFPKQSKVSLLVVNLWNRFVGYLLLRCSIQLLDQALKRKVGKLPSKSAQARAVSKAFNEGYQKAIKDYKDKWL